MNTSPIKEFLFQTQSANPDRQKLALIDIKKQNTTLKAKKKPIIKEDLQKPEIIKTIVPIGSKTPNQKQASLNRTSTLKSTQN
jgi:hypothetical protein